VADKKKHPILCDDVKVSVDFIPPPPKFYCTSCGKTEAVYVKVRNRFECPCGAMWTISFEELDYEDFDDE